MTQTEGKNLPPQTQGPDLDPWFETNLDRMWQK